MKFRTQYNFSEKDLGLEVVVGVSETDGSQNETLSQIIRRFVSQGIVIPPTQWEKETDDDVNSMLDGNGIDVTQEDDFDLADASEALAEAQEIVQSVLNKQKETTTTKDTDVTEKQENEPKLAQEKGE